MDAVAHGQPLAARLKLARRHGLHAHKEVMQAAGAGEAAGIGGVEQAVRIRQQLLGVLDSQELQKSLGADAGPAFEQSLQMIGADRQVGGQVIERRLLQAVRLQPGDGRGDQLIVTLVGGLFGHSVLLLRIVLPGRPPSGSLRLCVYSRATGRCRPPDSCSIYSCILSPRASRPPRRTQASP